MAIDKSATYRTIDCLTMIEQRLPALSSASRRVGEAILGNPWAVLGMTIYDVAEVAGVSLPSVTRFARAVGYPGFRELVQGIAQSLGRIEGKDIEHLSGEVGSGATVEALASRIVHRQIDALQTTVSTLDYVAVEAAALAIKNATCVSVIGHGSAYVPAAGLAVKLNWAGVSAFAATPDLFSNQIIATDKSQVVVGISHQGRTRDTIELLGLARQFGATTIGITTVPSSPLAAVSDIALSMLTPEVARAGTFLIAFDTMMVLFDILAATIAEWKWKGEPPNRHNVTTWIETNLRVGPTALAMQSHSRGDD